MFDVPIVLFTFLRNDKILKIIERLSEIKPKKIYIMSDQGRNDHEKKIVKNVRESIEAKIDWDCEIVKNYADDNRGVYENIGLGSKWVFEREKYAIFLEDDNYPEISFFKFCEDLLKYYETNDKVLWICGTNYLGTFNCENNESYVFTQNLLPCGWASWSSKFLKYYDSDLETIKEYNDIKKIKKNYRNKSLFKQQYFSIASEYYRKERGEKFRSWDYQMAYSIRKNNLLGISPCYNQITNIGVDSYSEHGGTSINQVMTSRFCEIPTKVIFFPLVHPKVVEVNQRYEAKVDRIILLPTKLRILGFCNRTIKRLLGVSIFSSIRKGKHDD